ncbi:Ribokinase-like protein [Lipomyces japonicus]|uniref:Ribokinase-like protein n=1 Tax=Lipomyces japonicus TaxID=56871 RepID=UPI0034CFB31C
MASSSWELLAQVRKFVPPLLSKFHKGQAGRVVVIGGSEDYTGAPFFAAQAATLLGADMSHIICEKAAGQVIKTYSPNLMVHPYMRDSQSIGNLKLDDVLKPIYALLDRIHVVVVGPGLGRDKIMLDIASSVIQRAREKDLHIVIDADGLYLVQQNPDVIKGYAKAILTPNIVEFQRLCNALHISVPDYFPESQIAAKELCVQVAKAFGGLTIIAKGQVDYISNGTDTLANDSPGGLKRVGGQGDTLSGTAATFLAWKYAYQNSLWQHDNSLSDERLTLLAAYGASSITRYCSRTAFKKYGRAMLASNLSEMIGDAYDDLIEKKLDGKI